jgi:hypothetical protein
MRSSPDKFCDGRTDGQTEDGEVIPMLPLLRRGDTKMVKNCVKYKTLVSNVFLLITILISELILKYFN